MIKKIFIGLGILLITILVGAGWYFSGLIYEGALNPDFTDSQDIGTAEDRVIVSQIDTKTITLNVEEELWGPLLENGTYGIIGQNGDAVVGEIISTDGNIVTRELLEINGNIVEGEKIRATSLVLINDEGYKILGTSGWSGQATEGVYTPKSVADLEYETINYTSEIGTFPAYLTKSGENGIVIFVHGFRGDYTREVFALMRTGEFEQLGFRSMIIAYRNDRGFAKDPSGIYQYGTTEWVDIDAAVNRALELTDNVILFGTSGGGGPISGWIKNVHDKNKVSGVIYEAPTINFWESVKVNGAARFPWLPPSTFEYFKIITEIRYDVDFDKMNFTEEVIASDIPVLLFHGDDDEWVPVEMSDYIASRRTKNFTYMRYENVGHNTAWNADPQKYKDALSTFLKSLD